MVSYLLTIISQGNNKDLPWHTEAINVWLNKIAITIKKEETVVYIQLAIYRYL